MLIDVRVVAQCSHACHCTRSRLTFASLIPTVAEVRQPQVCFFVTSHGPRSMAHKWKVLVGAQGLAGALARASLCLLELLG